MTYATTEQLIERFGESMLVQLTDREAFPTGEIAADVVARALAGTDAEINGSLAKRYRLPLAAVPELVIELAIAIAIYKLHRFAPDPKIEKDYERALAKLRQIAIGDVLLDVAGVEPTTSGAGGVVASDRPRDMTPGNLAGFI
ncbi:MAG: DUF1320 domain-containing protein [Pseudomonadota bacterium]